MGYCRAIWGYCRVLWLLQGTGGTGGYGVLGSTMGHCVVLWGYCMVLLVTAGYFWVLGGTVGYWVVLGCTEVHKGATKGTGGGYLTFWGVIENTVWYCRVLWGTAGYCQVLLGTRCILGEGGGTGGTLEYCMVLWVLGLLGGAKG